MHNGVEYRVIPGFSGFIAGSDGSIWAYCWAKKSIRETKALTGHSGAWVKRRLSECGEPRCRYQAVNICGRMVYVHRLVLEAFRGPCPSGMECLHDDDDGLNNKISNLRWGTHDENMAARSNGERWKEHLGRASLQRVAVRARIRERLDQMLNSACNDGSECVQLCT